MKNRSKFFKGAFVFGFLLLVIFSSQSQAQDTSGNRLEAAHRYMKISDVGKMVNDTIQQISLNIPANKRQEFVRYMNQLDIQRMENLMVTALVQHFTVDELRSLADFYGSDTGKSIMKKFPAYMASVMPSIQSIVIEKAKSFPQ